MPLSITEFIPVKYVKNNALKGKAFASLAEVNEHLCWWSEHVADKRIHGTTKRQVGTHFEAVEKTAFLSAQQSRILIRFFGLHVPSTA